MDDPTEDDALSSSFAAPWELLRHAWQRGRPIDLAAFLAAFPNLGACDLAEVVAVDQDERWNRRERITAESYFEAFPALKDDMEASLRVVYGEVLARIAAGESPDLEEFQSRFPWIAEMLALQWEVHEAFADEIVSEAEANAEIATALPPGVAEPDGYEVFEALGQGAHGVVYRARHRMLDRVVALKMLRDAPMRKPEVSLRFFEEARVMARLEHPHIVRVFDVGRHDGCPFIALELIEGESLEARLSGQVLPPREAASLVRTLATTIAFAHGHGIIHRDLKPSNILLDHDGQPKISDFGLAKLGRDGLSVTVTGQILGTPAYMAPEQAEASKGIGPGADIYSLGAILYEMLTGRPPLLGPTFTETLRLVATQLAVSPRAINALVPADLAAVCMHCLEKSPSRRYASAEALAADLQRFLVGEPTKVRPDGPAAHALRWARLNPLAAVLALGIVGAMLAGVAVSSYFAVRAAAREKDARLAEQRATQSLIRAARARDDEEGARRRAEQARDHAEWVIYAGTIERAFRDWDNRDFGKFYDRINKTRWDFRGPEFGLVYNLAHRRFDSLYGHTGPIRGVVFQPGGQLLISAGDDRTIRAWEPRSRRLVSTWDAGPAGIRCLQVDARTGTVASGGEDGFVTVRELAKGKTTRRWRASSGAVLAIGGGPSAGSSVTAGADGSLVLWQDDRKVRDFPGHSGPIHALSLDEAGKRLASAGEDGTVRVWEVESGKPLQVLRGMKGPVKAVAVSPDGRSVAAGGTDTLVHLWDAAAGDPIQVFPGHDGEVQALAFRGDGKLLVSGGEDGFVRAWDLASSKGRVVFGGSPGGVNSLAFNAAGDRIAAAPGVYPVISAFDANEESGVLHLPVAVLDHFQIAFSPDGRWVAAPTPDGGAAIRDVARGTVERTIPRPSGPIHGLCFTPDGTRLVVGGEGSDVQVWDVSGGGRPTTISMENDWTVSIAHHPTEPEIAVGSGGGRLWTFDTTTGRRIRSFAGHTEAPVSLAYTPDGTRVVTASMDQTVRVWDRADGRCLVTIHTPDPAIRVAISPDGERLVTTTWAETYSVWRTSDGRPLATVYGQGQTLVGVAFTPDGRRIVTASMDGAVRFWHAQSFMELFAITSKTDDTQLAVSPDGSRLAVAGKDAQLRVWDLRIGDPIESIHAYAGGVGAVGFRPDSKQFLIATLEGTLQLRDAASGEVQYDLKGHRGPVAAAYSPEGRLLASAGEDGGIRLWDTETGHPAGRLVSSNPTVRRLSFRPDGRRLATVDAAGTATLWDLGPDRRAEGTSLAGCLDFIWSPDGRRVAKLTHAGVKIAGPEGLDDSRPLPKSGASTQVVRWAPDGRTLYGLTVGGRVIAWDAARGTVSREWAAHPGAEAALAISPDGRLLATGGSEARVKLWDAGTGRLAYEIPCHSARVRDVAISRDGRRLLSGADDTTAKMIELWQTQDFPTYKR